MRLIISGAAALDPEVSKGLRSLGITVRQGYGLAGTPVDYANPLRTLAMWAIVLSPVDGYLNDRLPRLGDYVNTGRPVLSMVDANSFHVEGYFEETKLARIHVGDRVKVTPMGVGKPLAGTVESIVAGIAD